MTVLRQRMIEDMQLRGLAERTQDAYARVVRQLAEHYGRFPDQISEEERRQYLLDLKNDRCVSRSLFVLTVSGLKFFCERTLRREWPTSELARVTRAKKLPTVLSREGVEPSWSYLQRILSPRRLIGLESYRSIPVYKQSLVLSYGILGARIRNVPLNAQHEAILAERIGEVKAARTSSLDARFTSSGGLTTAHRTHWLSHPKAPPTARTDFTVGKTATWRGGMLGAWSDATSKNATVHVFFLEAPTFPPGIA